MFVLDLLAAAETSGGQSQNSFAGCFQTCAFSKVFFVRDKGWKFFWTLDLYFIDKNK